MTSQEMAWRDAIRAVLQDAGTPLHYQDIIKAIHDQGLRTLTGATPERTVNSQLSQMTRYGQPLHDPQIRRTARGYFEFINDALLPIDDQGSVEEPEHIEEDDELPDSDSKIRVACYGLHWARGQVDWAKAQLLGRAYSGGPPLDFADQHGVCLLHQNRFTVYIGQTADSLYTRLRQHDRTKSARWDTFSWFGFREVDDHNGTLKPLSSEIDVTRCTDLVETILIEAVEPPMNAQRGKHIGTFYQQVPSPRILEARRKDFFGEMAGL
jgi:hypothetical protein